MKPFSSLLPHLVLAAGLTSGLLTSGASAQQGLQFQGQDSFATSQTTVQRATTTTVQATPSADAAGLLGLKEPKGLVATLTIDDLVNEALRTAPDAKIAAQRVVQQDANLRRAWALLLPTLSVGAAYTHTCTGNYDRLDCGDRTTSLANRDQIDQQALLFQTLADVMGVAADAANDPDDAANFRARQNELLRASDDIKNTNTTPIVVQPASQLTGQVTLAVPLFNPRAYPALVSAMDSKDTAQLAEKQARQALVLSVVRAAYAAVTATRVETAAKRQVELATEQHSAVKARVDAHTQPPLAEKRAMLELLRAQQTLLQATSAAENALAVTGALVGREERFAISPPADPVDHDEPIRAGDAEDLVDTALKQRFEVKVQRTVVQVAERGVTEAWMQFLPTIGLSATARATSFTQGFVRDPVTGVLTINASLPLYDGGLRYAALDDSTSRVSEERVRLKQLEDRIAAQVRGNHRDVLVRQEAARLAKESATVAKEAQGQAQALFDAGVGTALDLTETNVALFAAETEALRTELDVLLARLGLRWAVGDVLVDGV